MLSTVEQTFELEIQRIMACVEKKIKKGQLFSSGPKQIVRREIFHSDMQLHNS